jgi:hypothetical protein
MFDVGKKPREHLGKGNYDTKSGKHCDGNDSLSTLDYPKNCASNNYKKYKKDDEPAYPKR